jgi:WD40 repeat protein
MIERPSENLGGLHVDVARQVEAVCRRFEGDWRAGLRPRLADYLGEVAEEARAALWAELEALAHELGSREEAEAGASAGAKRPPSTVAEAPTIPPRDPLVVPPGNEVDSWVHDEPTRLPLEDATIDLTPYPSAVSGARSPATIRYFGDYEIIREIARGGMGVVFEARQVSLNRKVALKMILAGQLADQTDVRRFYTEAEAAANLDHPGIVPIFEVGQHEGQHYFSMGFVEGQSLSQRLVGGPLPPSETAALMAKVAEAIEYAHQRGVIHRDLKPANILLDPTGNPRVTDFGLAKKIQGDSGLTGSGQIMGTPSYMPPEQAGGKRGEVGPPADVYALGATLYALLTGRPPFQAATSMDTVLQVISDEPVAPRRLNASIPLDLETICLKCLEKEPARRYSSAAALAQELTRFLAGEPILARPIGAPERLWRWCRRRPVVAGLGAAVAALVLFVAVAGPVVAVTQSQLRSIADRRAKEALKAKDEAHEAQKAEAARRLEAEQAGYEASTKALAADQALVQSYLSQAENLRNLAQPGRRDRALDLLKRATRLKHDTDSLTAKLGADSGGWRAIMTQFWHEQQPQLRTEATRWFGESSLKRIYDTRFPVVLRSSSDNFMTSRSGLALSDDGKWLAYFRVGRDGAIASVPVKYVEIIEADTGRPVRTLSLGQSLEQMNTLAFDALGEDVLVARAERPDFRRPLSYLIERWSRLTGKVTGTVTLPLAGSSPHVGLGLGRNGRLVFSADRKRLLSIPTEPDTRSTVWDLAAAKPLREFESDFTAEAFFPDAGRVIGMLGSDIVIRDVTSGGVTKRWPMPDGLVSVMRNLRSAPNAAILSISQGFRLQPDAQSLWVSPDGRWLAAFGQHPSPNNFDNGVEMPTTVFLFDAESWQLRVRIPIPDVPPGNRLLAPAPMLAFDAESHLLAVATAKSVCLFSVPDGTPLVSEALSEMGSPSADQPSRPGVRPVFTMPTGLVFARGTNRLYEAVHPSDLGGFPAGGSPGSGKRVDRVVLSWDVTLARTRIENHRHDGPVSGVKLDSRDRFVAAAGGDRTIRVWDRGGGLRWSVGYPGEGSPFYGIAMDDEGKSARPGIFDPTGAVFLTRLPHQIDVWDATGGKRRASFPSVLAVSPDHRYLVAPWSEGPAPARELRILDLSRNVRVLSIPVEQNLPTEAKFSRDSRFLIVGDRPAPGPRPGWPQTTPLIVDLAEARVVARLPSSEQWAIGPASKVVVVRIQGGEQGVLQAFELATGRKIGEFTSPIAGSVLESEVYPSRWIATDDRRMAVRLVKGTYPQREVKLLVWQFDNAQAKPTPIDGNWVLGDNLERWTHFDADGTRLLVSGSQKTGPNANRAVVELWDLAGPKRLMSTADGAPALTVGSPKLVFNPNQKAFATIHDSSRNPDGVGAILWETATGRIIGRYQGYQAELSEDGGWLEVREKGSSYLVSLKTHEVRAFPRERFHTYFGVPGRRTAVTSSAEIVRRSGGASPYDLTLTDVENGRTRAVLPDQWPLPGAFTPDGKRFATVSRQDPPALIVWEVETGKMIRSALLHNAIHRVRSGSVTSESLNVRDVHFSPDGGRLSFNLNERFRVLDVESGRIVAIDDRPGHRAPIRAVDISPDGTLIASAGDDAAVCFWEAATGRFVEMLEEETDSMAAAAFSPDGRSLAARATTGRMRMWRLDRTQAGDRGKVVATPAWDTTSLGSSAGASATAGPVFIDEGRLVAFGTGDGRIALRDTANGRVERVLKPESGQAAVVVLAAGRDGKRLVSADAEGIVRIWEPATQTPPKRLVTGQEAIRAVALAGNLLAVAGSLLDLWNVDRGERLVTLEADARAVNCLEISADGRILAVGDERKVVLRDLDEVRRHLTEIDLGW